MKNLTLTLVALATLGTSAAFAQEPGPRGGAPGQGRPGQAGGMRQGGMRRMAEMEKKILAQLNLTAEQKTKIEALQKKRTEKMEALRKDWKPGGDRKAMMEKMKPLREEYQKGMGAILTPEQKKKMQEMMKAEREKMQKAGGGRPGGRGI